MAKDTYLNLANGALAPVVKKLGLPQPVPLRRFNVAGGSGFTKDPVLVLGDSGADSFAELLVENGFSVHRSPDPSFKYQGIIASFIDAQSPDDLGETVLQISPALKQTARCARVVIVSRATEGEKPSVDAARNGVTGIVRSVAHEMRYGGTANGIVLDAGVDVNAASVTGALWFFLSAKSAYVSGQLLTVSDDRGQAVTASEFDGVRDNGPLVGKIAVVTGAARGIGAAIARTLHRDGAYVYGVDVPQAGQALAATMNAVVGKAIHLDITAEDAASRIAQAVGKPIDILIHNAGITRDKLLANMDAGRWNSVIAVNIESQLRMNEKLTELGAWGSQPHVVSLASTSGIAGNRGQTNYAASKAGVIGMVAASQDNFAKLGGSINAVAPGFIETDMTAKMSALTRQVARRLSSLQQGGLPEDVAEAIAFLSSPAATGVNGQTLRVCGQNMVGA